MFKSTLEQYVTQAVESNIKSDTISKSELTAVITDSLYAFVTSSDFIDLIDEELAKKMQLLRRGV